MEMGEEPCNVGLALGLWEVADVVACSEGKRRREPIQFHILFPPCAKQEEAEGEKTAPSLGEEERRSCILAEDALERKAWGVGTGGGNADKGGAGARRKKLRLTREQSSLLEDSFREHSTLTPSQKQELAAKLDLRPRQVEVWFQNRRARTKLKQTEEDCEFLKKCCESLSDENRRLKKELQELRSLRHGCNNMPLHHLHLPKAAAAPAMCPSCERIAPVSSSGGPGPAGVSPAGTPTWFYDRATIKNSSVAC
ncbi:hypothetical protein Taro_011600 [Colocasia esculenta]|uniref:Homeobox domain-containing protein n=1 Tax=Colocasia esculenta TaxID=4460 RepID=A0A843U6C7_COLES|nr:hypothetical protein [Colocasia esculenta]